MKLFNARKYVGCIILFVALIFTSCQNDAVDIVREDAKINILLNNVLSPFTAYTQSNMDMYKGGGISSKIVVKAFVYDDSGHLINSISKKILDYSQSTVSFTTPLTGSHPLIVCIAYATFTNSEGKTYNAYEVSGEQLLSAFKVTMSYANDSYICKIPWAVLGGAIYSSGISSEGIDIEMKPLGALAYLDWQNIHSHDNDSKVPQRYNIMQKYNDVVTVNNGAFLFSSTLSSTYYFYQEMKPSIYLGSDNIYGVEFLLPGTVESFGYGGYSPSNYDFEDDEEWLDQSAVKSTEIIAGKQYVVSLDCDNYLLNVKEGIYR